MCAFYLFIQAFIFIASNWIRERNSIERSETNTSLRRQLGNYRQKFSPPDLTNAPAPPLQITTIFALSTLLRSWNSEVSWLWMWPVAYFVKKRVTLRHNHPHCLYTVCQRLLSCDSSRVEVLSSCDGDHKAYIDKVLFIFLLKKFSSSC